jgi:NAD-dependent SIR2 family protein deacetylase
MHPNVTSVGIPTSTWQAAADAIRRAEALLITAGAGMGVDSGLPDFRGRHGFWRAYPAIANLGLSFEEMANPEWFVRAPELAWAFYGHRLNLYRATPPHEGFAKLLAWTKQKPHGGFIYTSNVDGHFERAGFAPDQIVECHGSIHHFQCCQPCGHSIWDAASETVCVEETQFRAVEPRPVCRHCGALARPNVLMFGDAQWIPDRTGAQHRRLEYWLRKVRAARAPLAVLEFGAGTAVPSVRLFSETVARDLRGVLIRVNPREAQAPRGHIELPAGALATIHRLESLMAE